MFFSTKILKTKLKFWISDQQIDDWYKSKTIFFMLGVGRSGTNYFSNFLSQADNAIVYHEPIKEDFTAFVEAHKFPESASEYINGFRKKHIYEITSKIDVQIYGETNSALRYHAAALKQAIPEAKYLHLIRDGRDVVRSIMARKHYTNSKQGHHELMPKEDDPLYSKWGTLSRFEKICWLWADGNRQLRQDISQTLYFEKLINDYDYFHKNIVEDIGIDIDQALWHKNTNTPQNVTKSFSMPRWQDWDKSLIASFDKICGEEMEIHGYY